MTLNETLKQLQRLGSAKVRAQNAKSGAGDKQFGVSLGDIRALAKKIRTDHPLALSLWKTGNVDAQFLAALLIQPTKLSAKEMDLSGLPRFEGLHVTLRPDLDSSDGEPASLERTPPGRGTDDRARRRKGCR